MLIVWVAARSVSKKSARRSVESVSSIALVSIGSFLFIEARRERERERRHPPSRKSIAGSARTASRRRACVLPLPAPTCLSIPLLSPRDFFPSRIETRPNRKKYPGSRIFSSLSLSFFRFLVIRIRDDNQTFSFVSTLISNLYTLCFILLLTCR